MHHFDEQTVQEQKAWEHYAKVKAENHHLKKLLKNKEKTILGWQSKYGALNKKYKTLLNHRKPKYRNNGKKKIK
ncbi:MAG: hypothetical protein ABS960_00730 [Solibacillus isronensis]